jgi:hypothetical protein
MGARVRCAARRRGSEPARGLSALHEDVVRRRTPSVVTGRNEKEGGEEAKRKREPKLRSKWQVNARFAARNRDRITSPLIEDDAVSSSPRSLQNQRRPKDGHLPPPTRLPTHTQAAGAGGCRGTRAPSCFEGLSDVLRVGTTVHSWGVARMLCFPMMASKDL